MPRPRPTDDVIRCNTQPVLGRAKSTHVCGVCQKSSLCWKLECKGNNEDSEDNEPRYICAYIPISSLILLDSKYVSIAEVNTAYYSETMKRKCSDDRHSSVAVTTSDRSTHGHYRPWTIPTAAAAATPLVVGTVVRHRRSAAAAAAVAALLSSRRTTVVVSVVLVLSSIFGDDTWSTLAFSTTLPVHHYSHESIYHPPLQRRRRRTIPVLVSANSQQQQWDNTTIVSRVFDDSDEDDDINDENEVVILQKVNGRYAVTASVETVPSVSEATERLEIQPPSTASVDRNTKRSRHRYHQTSVDYSNDNVAVSSLDRNAEYRYSVKDWLPIMCSIFQSSTLQYTRGPIVAVMIWSFILCTLQQLSSIYINYLHMTNPLLQQIYIFTTNNIIPSSTIAHSTTVAVLGLLLVFRTTSAYQKFDEGRLIWERILSISRNMTRQIYLYPEFRPVRSRILQLLAAYPYFLHQHVVKRTPSTPTLTTPTTKPSASTTTVTAATLLNPTHGVAHRPWRPKWNWFRPGNNNNNIDPTSKRDVVTTSTNAGSRQPQVGERPTRQVLSNQLPWSLFLQTENTHDALHNRKIIQQLMYTENRPLYICDEIGKEIITVPYSHTYSSMERMVLLQLLNELTEAVSECERINHTAVPLNYARHSLRGLTIWLLTLPISLLPTYDWWTAPIMGLTAWLYYGIYQIGYIVEDPFQRTIRLTTICDTIYRDVICTEQRTSAFDDMILSGDIDGEWKDLPL